MGVSKKESVREIRREKEREIGRERWMNEEGINTVKRRVRETREHTEGGLSTDWARES